MLKTIITISTFFVLVQYCYGQNSQNSLSDQDWNKIIKYLSAENWHKAEKITKKYLDNFNEDEKLVQPAILRYMYLRCVAAQFSELTYDQETALKKISWLKGKTIITPPTEINPNRMFNGLTISEDSTCLFSCASNNDMTEIHCFESYYFLDSTYIKDFSQHIGKTVRIAAILKDIEVVGFTMPGFKIEFIESFIWSEE